MKTFEEFILICEKLNKTHDENSQSKIWNYFIANPDSIKIRELILSKDFKEAEKEIKNEVEKAKTDLDHPLNFNNAGEEDFSKATGKEPKDEKEYNNFLDDSISGLLALSKQKKLKSAIEKGLPSRVTGSGQAELSKNFKGAGGVDKTPKGDLEIFDPDNPKYRVGISMKKGAGAQLASAEGGEIKGMYKIAAKEYIKKFHSNKSKEEQQKIEKEIMDDAERLSAIGRLQRTAGEAQDAEKQKQSLKNVSQDISNKLLEKHPQFERFLSQVATSGKGKFKGDEGTAGIVLTGKTNNKEATAKPSGQQKSSKPRLALPKGKNRPGNLKIDYRPEEPVSRQSSFSNFSKQMVAAQQALNAAVKEREEAQKELETNPDGTRTYLQHQAQKRLNNPKLDARITAADNEIQMASDALMGIEASASQVMEPIPASIQQQEPTPKETNKQQPAERQQPQGPMTAAQQAAQRGLTGDGHGRWFDKQGNLVARTERGQLKFIQK